MCRPPGGEHRRPGQREAASGTERQHLSAGGERKEWAEEEETALWSVSPTRIVYICLPAGGSRGFGWLYHKQARGRDYIWNWDSVPNNSFTEGEKIVIVLMHPAPAASLRYVIAYKFARNVGLCLGSCQCCVWPAFHQNAGICFVVYSTQIVLLFQ